MVSDFSLMKMIVLAFLLGAVIQDLLWRKVLNAYILVGLLVIALTRLTVDGFSGVSSGLLSALLCFAVGFALWRFGALGAGDVKVLSLVTLSVSWPRGFELLFYSLAWGSLLGLLALGLDRAWLQELRIYQFHPVHSLKSLRVKNHKIPFTVGILLGTLSLWLLQEKGVLFL